LKEKMPVGGNPRKKKKKELRSERVRDSGPSGYCHVSNQRLHGHGDWVSDQRQKEKKGHNGAATLLPPKERVGLHY